MRIVGGEFRGRNLVVPNTPDTRPTMDRTREAVFNILRSASWAKKSNGESVLMDAQTIDVFAGSGAMGFEALSQGAAFCHFVDNGKLAIEAIQQNIEKIGLQDYARILKSSVENVPSFKGDVCSLAFFDPPYKQNLVPAALKTLSDKNYINNDTLLVLEMHKHEDGDEEIIDVLDTRLYGASKIIFARLKV